MLDCFSSALYCHKIVFHKIVSHICQLFFIKLFCHCLICTAITIVSTAPNQTKWWPYIMIQTHCWNTESSSSRKCGLVVKIVRTSMLQQQIDEINTDRNHTNGLNRKVGRPVHLAAKPAVRKAGLLHPLVQVLSDGP